MEYIQIFNRITGQWSERYSQTAGFSESWVIDKTTDTGKDWRIEINGETPPNIQPNDWVRVAHINSNKNRINVPNGTDISFSNHYYKEIATHYELEQAKRYILSFNLNITSSTLDVDSTDGFGIGIGYGDDEYETDIIYSAPFKKPTATSRQQVIFEAPNISRKHLFIRFIRFANETSVTASVSNVMLEKASIRDTASDYMPYEAMTYNADGIPTNSTQYLIKDVSCDYFWQSKKWIVGFTLKEPIERFNGVHGETLSFTNQTQKAYDGTTYYKAPYNHYTALRRWLMVTPANCDSYTAEAQAIKSGKILGGETLRVYTNAPLGNYYGSNFSIGIYEAGSPDLVLCDVFIGGSLYQQKYLIAPDQPNPYIEFNLPITVGTASSDFPETIKYIEQYPQSANNISWYNRIKVIDSEWLKTLPFADATFNELNLYNVLMDNFDASTGRTPVAYFDIDPVTDLPRNLDRDEYLLKFERQDGFDKPVIDFSTLKANNIGYSVTQESGNFATGLVCNAENLSAAAVVNYPAQGLYAVPEVDTDNRVISGYTTEGTENWILKVPLYIKKVKSIEKLTITATRSVHNILGTTYSSNVVKANRSEYIKEKQEYGAADLDSEGARYYWYKQGENVIHLREVYYDTNNITVVYYIEYEPLISCRLLIGDTAYQQQINQTTSQIDAEKFSKYANEYLNGMNKADITIGKHYKRFSDFENLIGSRVQDGSKTYMITQVAYKNIGMAGYDVFMQLNENHTRKNNAYNAPQTIRTNTAIATENIKNRQTAIKQVIKIGTTPQTAEGYQFLTDKKIALSALKPNAIDSKYYPQVALFKGYSKLFTNSDLTASSNFVLNKLTTVAKFQFGKQINFVTTFFDNADAGKYKELSTKSEPGAPYTYFYDIGDPENQVPTLYTDPFGEIQKTSIQFSSLTTEAFDEGKSTSQSVYYDRVNSLLAMAKLPNIDNDTITELENNSSVEVENQIYFKDMLEKLNNNVIVEYNGVDVIVCNDLIKLSRLLNQIDNHNVVKVRFFDRAKSENDDVTTGLISTIGIASSTLNASDIRYTLDSGVDSTEGLSMILLTANHEKLLIFNNISATIAEKLSSGYFDVYFA